MTEDQKNNQQPKPKKIVKFATLFKSKSENAGSNNTGTQIGPIIPVNANGKRRIYLINTAKTSGATRTPVILPSGIQPKQCSQITPQSSPTPNSVPTNEIKIQESPQKSSTDLEPTTTSPTKTYRSRRDEIIDSAMKKMAEKHNTGVRPNQLVKSSSLLLGDEEDEEGEGKNATVRARMPVCIHPYSNRKFSVLRYNKEDVQLCSTNEVFLQRENNMELFPKPFEKKSTGGAGSEFGAGRRLKVRFQKRGSEPEEYSAEKQPLLLTVGKGKSAKNYRGVKEDTLVDSKYFIFTHRSNGGFDAYPVNEWYTVKQRINSKHLNDEEAEREFSNRDKVYNKFNTMKNPKQEMPDQSIIIENTIVKPKLVLTEFDEWKACDQSDDEMELEGEESDIKQIIAQKRLEEKRRRRAAIVASKRRGRNALARRKHKRNFIDGSDEEDGGHFDVAGEESDVDDYDEYELDYLTDSTSDEDKLSEDEREKIYEIPCIDQEMGFISDDDDDDDSDDGDDGDDDNSNNEEEENRENGGENEKEEKREDAQSQQQNQRISSEIFLDEKEKSEKTSLSSSSSSSSSSSCSSDTEEDFNEESQKKCSKSLGPSESSKSFSSGKKRLPEGPSAESSPPPKRFKLSEIPHIPSSNPSVNVPQEELFGTIRKYLLRRPITHPELMRKLGKRGLLSSDAALNASRVAEVLQTLKPLQQRVNGKVQFYLKY